MTRQTEPTRTDRGFVVISDMEDSRKHIEICVEVRPNGKAKNVLAEHVGVREVVIGSPQSFRRNGGVLTSTQQMEVFVDADDQKLHVAPMADWDRLRT